MRKILTTVLLLILVLTIPTTTIAFADEITTINEYYKVTTEDVCLCDVVGNSATELFKLPKTYFLLIDTSRENKTITQFGDSIEFVPVKYKGYTGYIPKKDINNGKIINATQEENNKLTEQNAYLNKNITLKTKFEGATATIEQGKSLIFMGFYNEDVVVFYNNKLVNIPKTSFDAITYDDHYFPEDINTEILPDAQAESPYNRLNTVVLIVGLTLASVIIIAVIFFPKKKSKTREDKYYEDNYYENYRDKYDTRNN